MRPSARFLLLGSLLCSGCGAAQGSAPPPSILPLTTLRLYETGVGYFERSGTLQPAERTALPVPASHLDDALKSLVVLTPGHSDPLHGIEFGSSMSRGMARAMAGLPADADAPITYRDLLASLKGAHVEVKTRTASFVGRLVDVDATQDVPQDREPAPKAAPRAPAFRLVVLTDQSELVRVPAEEVTSVRPTDGAYAARLDAALDALSMHSAQSGRMLDLVGASRGPVTLAYIAETPVWRTTYRLVLDGDGKRGTLQAWALLHNDTDENWQSVKVELVNGRPDSFLFPLAAPRYARRTLVHPEDELSTVPQLLDKTADAIWGDNVEDSFGAGGMGLSGVGEGGGGHGEGVGLGSFGSIGHGAGSGVGSSSVLKVGDLAIIGQATGAEAGALFVYGLPDRLALRAHASALVPFLQQPIDAESIAWVDRVGEPARSAVRFVNSTSQTLPGGTIAFFGDGGFAGESGLDRLKPGERRFVRFGADLDVEVGVTPGSRAGDATERLTYARGTLVEHFLRTLDTSYSFENRSARPRAVYLVLHIGRNAKVTGADEVDFDSASATPVAVVRVGGRVKVAREIVTVEGLSREVSLAALTSEQLAKLAASPALAARDKAVAADAVARQKELEDTRRAKKQAIEEVAAIEKELARLREDSKALGGERGAAPPAEFVKRILAAEDRHAALRKQLDALEVTEKARVENVGASLAKLDE